jgi:hypothetical protein
MKLEPLLVQSDNNRFVMRANRDNNMATEGHRFVGRKGLDLMSDAEWDEELAEMNMRLDEIAIEMWHDRRSRWMYEWPMKKAKEKWPVKELMVIRQRRLLRGWLSYAENLNGPEEEMVQVCEPENGRNLSELGSAGDLKNCQEGGEEILDCQVGNELRSLRDLTNC